ncbi:MAG: CheR family methyltransferase [Thermoguttaceae bacterium]
MTDPQLVEFLQWALPRLRLRWPGFRKVRRQVRKRINGRMRELGLAEISDYRSYLELNAEEWPVLDGLCRIAISRFYRDRGVFDWLGDRLLPELARMATARGESRLCVWCAGCASGEETYTLSILWKICIQSDFPAMQLGQVATDVDPHILERARQAIYSGGSLKNAPRDWLDTAFFRQDDQYQLRPEFRVGIEFRQQDIRREMPDGPFHLVMCRHLAFTYFAEDLQREILSRIVDRIVPGGCLLTGKQEPLPKDVEGIVSCGPNLGAFRVEE